MIIYVSGKYSGDTPEEIQGNILKAERYAIEVWNKGHQAFCPHLNTRLFESKACKAKYEDYLSFDMKIICICDAMLMIPDWKDSQGAVRERDYAKQLGIPIYNSIEEIPNTVNKELERLLAWYNEYWAIARQRIVKGAIQYGDDWKFKDHIKEIFYELTDIPNYKALEYAQQKHKEANLLA